MKGLSLHVVRSSLCIMSSILPQLWKLKSTALCSSTFRMTVIAVLCCLGPCSLSMCMRSISPRLNGLQAGDCSTDLEVGAMVCMLTQDGGETTFTLIRQTGFV